MSQGEVTDTTGRPASVISFFGSTGGLACTTSVANVGWILASTGKKVLLVDWNLDDPKLHRFFTPFIVSEEALAGTNGAVDMVLRFREAVEGSAPLGAGLRDLAMRHTELKEEIVTLDWSAVPGVPAGQLDFLGPGRRDGGYEERVARYERENFEDDAYGREFFAGLRSNMLDAGYDYVLLDSRTGARFATQACTTQLPETAVVSFQLTRDGIDVAARVARKLQSNAPASTRIVPIATRVDSNAGPALDDVRDYAYQQFEDVLAERDRENRLSYWAQAELPSRPYATEDVLAPFIERPGHPAAMLLSAYERFTALVTDGAVTRLGPLPEEHRQQIAEQFGKATRRQVGNIALVGDPKDRAWIDWVQAQLEWAGLDVIVPRVTEGEPDLPEATTTLVLVSPNLEGSPVAAPLRQRIFGRDPVARADDRSLVAVRIHERSVPETYRLMPQINLTLLDETEARQRLVSFLRSRQMSAIPLGVGPTDGPRFPKDTPRLSKLPDRNYFFTGREELLQTMRDNLGTSVRDKPPLALTGIPCVGKSAIALEYAWRFQADYDLIWWISATDPHAVRASLHELAQRLGLAPRPQWLGSLFDALRTDERYKRCLLVYDDTQSPGDLDGLIPAWGHALVTSYHNDWNLEPQCLSVDAFHPEESVALLRRRTSIWGAQAASVAEAMGHLPLCLDHASAVLSSRLDLGADRDPVAELFRMLDQEANAIGAARQHDSAGARLTTAVAMNEVSAHYAAAGRLLKLCAFLSPEGVGMDLIRSPAMTTELGDHDKDFARNQVQLPQLLHQITRFSLVKRNPDADTLTMNPLLQRHVRERMSDDERVSCQQAVQHVLSDYSPPDTEMDDSKHDRIYEELARHVVPSGAAGSDDPEVRRWLVNQVRHHYRTDNFSEARQLGRQLFDAWTDRFDERDELRLRMGTQLANTCRSLGRYEEAFELVQPILDLQRELHGLEHRFTLMTQRGHGADMHARGLFQEGLALDQATYDIYQNAFGDEHPNTLLAGEALARTLFRAGRWVEARSVAEDTFATRRRVMEDHVLTWVTGVEVGRGARLVGEPDFASRVLRLCHERLVEIVGETSGRVYRAARQLAATHRYLGQPDPALVEARRAYEGCAEFYGVPHPATMASATELAACMMASGDPEAGLDQAVLAREMCTTIYGPDHPYVSVIQANEATYALACGRTEDAADSARAAWTALDEHPDMGPAHPATLAAALTYANTLVAEGELAQADVLENQVYQGFSAMFGEDHPYTELAFTNRQDTMERRAGTTDPQVGSGLRHHIDGEVITI